MKKEIWKFELDMIESDTIDMPIGAEILTVQAQNGFPCLWALVDPLTLTEKRFFEEKVATVYSLKSDIDRVYLGTYKLYNGSLVFHVFEKV